MEGVVMHGGSYLKIIWVGREQEGADEKAYRQAKGSPTKHYFCLHADGISDMKYAGTKLMNQTYLNKSALAQKVYSRSARWVMRLWHFCCSTKSPQVRFSVSLKCSFKSQLPHVLFPFGKKQASKDSLRSFPSYSFHLIFQFEEIDCMLISPPFSQFLPFGWCLWILFQCQWICKYHFVCLALGQWSLWNVDVGSSICLAV